MKTKTNQNHFFSKLDYTIVLSLLLLSAVPIFAGMMRVQQIAVGKLATEDIRFYENQTLTLVHMISVTIFSLLGAFQFAPGFRKRFINLHRVSGVLLLAAGFLVATTGFSMTLLFPFANMDGIFIYTIRLVVSAAMITTILLSIGAIFLKDFMNHGHWMIRSYALALGAGTQVLTHIPWMLFPHLQNEFTRAISMTLGWIINIAVAEWIINKQHSNKKETI